MDVLSGSFGVGHASIEGSTIQIRPNALFSGAVTIHMGEIASVDPLGGHARKKMGETVGLGATGAAIGSIFGPVGTLVGAAAGALAGGKSDHVTFGCRLKDGRSFVARASAAEFYELQGGVSEPDNEPNISEPSDTPRKPRKPRVSKAVRDRAAMVAKSKPLQGREDAEPAEADCMLYRKLKEDLQSTPTGSPQYSALAGVLAYARKFHRIKWRYFDTALDDADVRHAVMLKIIAEKERADLCMEYHTSVVYEAETYDEKVWEHEKHVAASQNSVFGEWLRPTGDSRRYIEEYKKAADEKQVEYERAEEQSKSCKEGAQSLIDGFSTVVSANDLTNFTKRFNQFVKVSGTGMNEWRLSTTCALQHLYELYPNLGETPIAETSVPARIGVKDRLVELKGLLDDGLISEEEFSDRRKAILDAI